MPDIDIEQRLKKKKKRRRIYLFSFLLIVAAALAYYLSRPEPLPFVRTAAVVKETSLAQTLSVSAEVSPVDIQTVAAVNQSILRIPVAVGDSVKKGDILIVLGKKSLEEDLIKAREARIEAEQSLTDANSALAAAQTAAASASEMQISGMLNQITAQLQNALTQTLADMTGQLRSQFPSAEDFANMTAEQLIEWQKYLDGLRADLDKWIAQIPDIELPITPAPEATPTPTPTPTPSSVETTASASPISSSSNNTASETSSTVESTEPPTYSTAPTATEQTQADAIPTTTVTSTETQPKLTESTVPVKESETKISPGLKQISYAKGGSASLLPGVTPDLSQFLSGSGMAGDALASTMAQGEALVEQLKAAEVQAQEALDNAKTEIRSEVNGIVVTINAEVGEPQTTNSANVLGTNDAPAMIIYDDSSLIASFRANRYDAIRLEKGQKVHYTADNLSFEGKVIYKSPIATTNTAGSQIPDISSMSPFGSDAGAMLGGEALVDVEMSLEGEKLDQLIIGFPIDAEIVVSEVYDVLAVPAEALIKETDSYFVYVIDANDFANKREVVVGIQADINAEIISGLSAGEIVVLNPTGTIKEGMQVTYDE